MPFTFSHPALVLPFGHRKFGLSLTGLFAGSMVPDFEYYFRMRLGPTIGHETLGFFLFDIPVALLMAFLFHALIRDVFIEHLPAWLRERFLAFRGFNWTAYAFKNKIIVLLSVVIGVVSHLFWDAFTHYDGFFVLLWPALNKSVNLLHIEIPVYFFLQIASSVIGLWVMYYIVKSMPRQENTSLLQSKNKTYWMIFASLTALIFIIRYILIPYFLTFWDFFMAAMGSLLYAWLLTSLFYKYIPSLKLREEKP